MIKVLFIDDDPQAHRTLGLVLPEQYALISAYTAKQGIEAARREPPDLVLLDINLPDFDGIAVLREIASRPAAPPVIMLMGAIIRQYPFARAQSAFSAQRSAPAVERPFRRCCPTVGCTLHKRKMSQHLE